MRPDRVEDLTTLFIGIEPVMKKNLDAQGMVPTGGTPQQFNDRIQREYARWVKVVKERNIKVQ